MAVVTFIETHNGKASKASLELLSYGRSMAAATSASLIAVIFSDSDTQELKDHGADVIYTVDTASDSYFNLERYSATLAEICALEKATLVVVSSSSEGRYLGPSLAVKTEATYLSNAVALPTAYNPLTVKQSCFTNKGFAISESLSSCTVLSLSSNAFGIHPQPGRGEVKTHAYASTQSKLVVTKVEHAQESISIADADIVVSGGRGLKGPEHWHLIEDLASTLGAATACSKPVSDLGWRPHSEHVGQTGKPVASNLYIAIGISGAIQHLAGINASKVKVVINNDPEAPFFKAADYGIVGDAFEVVPVLIEKLKALKKA